MASSKKRRTQSTGKSPSKKASPLERHHRIIKLADLYGAMLTDRQLRFLKMHFEEDLSFSEIAEIAGISRQAVHLAVKNAEKSLENIEKNIKFAKFQDDSNSSRNDSRLDECCERLESVNEQLKRAGGILYDTASISKELTQVLEKLNELKRTSER